MSTPTNTPGKTPAKSAALRVAAHRQRKRKAGLVAKTIWVPDTKDPKFIEEYRRQARSIAADRRSEDEIMTWIDEATKDVDLGAIPPYQLPEK